MYRVFYAILFYFVDYRIPLSQIKIVLFILANRECLIRRRHCINIVFIVAGHWKARVICGVLILENYPSCVLPLRSKYESVIDYWNKNSNKLCSPCQSMIRNIYIYLNFLTKIFPKFSSITRIYKTVIFPQIDRYNVRLLNISDSVPEFGANLAQVTLGKS